MTYGGTIIGTYTGNSLLVITFNANANQAAVEALTRNITYSNSSNYISTLTRTLRFTLTDGDGGTSTSVDQTLNISDVNDAPFHTVPGTQTIIEETQTVLSGISLNDPDAFATDVFTTQLTVSNGIIDVTLSGTATISAGANSSATLTITGQAGDIDTTLSTIKYTGNTNISGIAADTLTLFTNDNGNNGNNGNNGAGGAKTGTNTIQIDITNINDAPTLSNGNTGGSANEGNGHLPYSVATVADNDNTDFDGGELTFSIASGSDGKESLFLTPLGGVSTSGSNVYVSALLVGSFTGGSNGTPLTISFNTNATQTQVQSIYQALTIGAISGEENPTTGLRNLEVVLTDGDGGISNVATASMTINAVNDAPVNTLPASITVIEDVATIINGISIVDVDDNGASMLVTLSVPTGSLAATTSGGVTVGGTASDLTLTGSVTNINISVPLLIVPVALT